MQRPSRLIVLLILFLTAPGGRLWSQTDEPHEARAGREARTVRYAAKDIVQLATRPRFTTLILLPPQERILDFVIGDKDAWVLEGTQNFAYLKPTKPGLETSMNLITASGNIYTFYCVSAEGQPDLKVFVEPADEKQVLALNGAPRFVPAADVDQVQQAASLQVKAAEAQSERFRADYPVRSLKADYKFAKNKRHFRVSAIYHDDKFTYIHSSATEKPALYEVKDGQPALINFTLDHGVYVIEHVMDKGYLAIGKHKMTFEREGL